MTGRVALVLGGGTGLGRELAWGLTDAGMSVAVIGPSGDEPQVAAALETDGRRAVAVPAAVAAPAGVSAAFRAAAGTLGPPDLVVHALTDPAALVAAPIAETEPSAWDQRCEAVLRGALACAQAAWEVLQGRGGRIVFVTPTVALTGAAQLVPYVSAV
ncbi:MAG TPA: SDR family NAD(P)-dependent oxidoreductase, partial [Acidimicrobiia bacterium]|nr:SDR family NAD(P)-dependent oxidoreductase [Acidimicrobiia bacterium]